jgi:two-component system cell cycle sensor histidine kinase/response regulator CckA
MNLLGNAMEALDHSGVVTVRTKNCIVDRPIRGYDTVNTGEYTVLSVSDTGSGIPPGDLDRIFEPFYTKKIMGRSGTGLGLAIVWNTVQDHTGYISVTSSKNGTCFDLYFPSTRSKVATDKSNTSIDAFKGIGECILVVDDDPTQREIASAMLLVLGYRVNTVDSGEAAVCLYQRHLC